MTSNAATANKTRRGDEILPLLVGVNAQVIDTFVDAALNPHEAPASLAALRLIREPLCALDATARARLAQLPQLLATMHFNDLGWWREMKLNRLRGNDRRERVPHGFARRASDLARATLMLTWHSARADRINTVLLLGIAENVVPEIADLSPSDVIGIAQQHAGALKPRWDVRPDLWLRLIEAARSGDSEQLRNAQMLALQIAGAELLRPLP